ncbi:hypothetical protein MUK70_05660 [Dyadobacter chenwenxiniae]|uniref:Uncharacterized protein n=1 Tax=Dyadobacter chenwenxiniae TaxID=2906456 RepID=A0A9X1PQN2_9BACT|nr:hypothetical protein [Dyadobacter chenwenxiniae]MCF0065258.1 hypothetical protein [Dyadobacter chenwenxiniae]UON84473.1 hypothetical protein MUK70_05660 [Dyadobacter chenwenxiniae]
MKRSIFWKKEIKVEHIMPVLVFAMSVFICSCSKDKAALSNPGPDLTGDWVGVYTDTVLNDGWVKNYEWTVTKASNATVNIVLKDVFRPFPGGPMVHSDTARNVRISNGKKLDFWFLSDNYHAHCRIEVSAALDKSKLRVKKKQIYTDGGNREEALELNKN